MSDNMQPTDEVLDDEVLDEAEGADSFDEVEEFDPFEDMSDEELDALCDEDESLAGFGDVEPGFRSGFVALVGRPNAGKSTLLNALTDASVLAEDMLFATLDPVVRQAELPNGTEVLISDTVGFINKLPHDLVEAFRSTLEEAANTDIILHVVDRSSPYYESQMAVVEDVLSKLGALDIPRINVYNKCDLTGERTPNDGVFISAAKGMGIDELLEQIESRINSGRLEVDVVVPYDKYEAMNVIRAEGRILKEDHQGDGAHLKIQINETALWKLKRMLGEGYGQN